MNTRRFRIMSVISAVTIAIVLSLPAQNVLSPDLKTIPEGKNWKVFNRSVAVVEQDGKLVAEFDGKPGDGMAWLDGLSFTNGTIECDMLGRSTPIQGSFIGIAFGIQDTQTYDAVYFRPFNFRSEDPERRAHSVQYVSHPDWTWSRLRQERPGQYEKPIEPPPDGDRWFHVRIVISQGKVTVFLNEANEPCLEVQGLSGPRTGSIAIWVGNNSPGKFANLRIRS